jgi:pentatricopeptide repeat protein
MSSRGFAPTATTYTALISAHAKANQLDAALATFQKMVCQPPPQHPTSIPTPLPGARALIWALDPADLAWSLFSRVSLPGKV